MAADPHSPAQSSGYLPALRFRFLTPLFDSLIATTVRESTFKPALLDQADLRPRQRVLDLGCGTGTLAIMAKHRQPDCELIGLDADPPILALAQRKAQAAALEIGFDQGLGSELPYEDASFDRVLSTLFFHHLSKEDKCRTLSEVARVLRPSGELHFADWTSPADSFQALLSLQVRLFDGLERTRENFSGGLPRLIEDAGFAEVAERTRYRTLFGTLGLIRARR